MHYRVKHAAKDFESAREAWNELSDFWSGAIPIHDKSIHIYPPRDRHYIDMVQIDVNKSVKLLQWKYCPRKLTWFSPYFFLFL